MLISRRLLTILLLPAVNNCVHCLAVFVLIVSWPSSHCPQPAVQLCPLSPCQRSLTSTCQLSFLSLCHYPYNLPSSYFTVSPTAILTVSRPTVLIVYLPFTITVSSCQFLSLCPPASYHHCLALPVNITSPSAIYYQCLPLPVIISVSRCHSYH
jgi:hypothetical protein